jgi:hypothetical protein
MQPPRPPGLRIHPRTRTVGSAERKLGEAIDQIIQEYQPTYIELAQILASVQLSYLKYALRHERHPNDPEKGADEA